MAGKLGGQARQKEGGQADGADNGTQIQAQGGEEAATEAH
jgi:hypothetical protein